MSFEVTPICDAPWAGPEPEFAVLSARPVRYAAAPMLSLDLQVSEPSGRQVYMIALTIQLMIEPARRAYDDETRAKLLELFGEPERWAVTTRSLVWSKLDVLVPAFTGQTTVAVPVNCSYDLELAAAKYLYSLPDGMAPLALHFNGTIYYRDDAGGLQMVLVPWNKSIDYRMPVAVWRETVEHYYPNTGWAALGADTLQALQRAKLERGLATLDATVGALLREAGSSSKALEALVESLLWEGYALYPYTPSATKNATPTPFGIAYPPAYAEQLASTYSYLELRVALSAPADAALSAEVRFLAPVGEGHQAQPERLTLPGAMVGALAHDGARKRISVPGAAQTPGLEVALSLAATASGPDEFEVTFRVENLSIASSGLGRREALTRSLLSVHPILHVAGGRFVSALERPCGSVNTFPVLAADDDSAVVGAAIVLPDHPQIAPESRGGLFDSTEIEEALLLHLQVLSDGERAELEQQDPAVREMLARAAQATPEDIRALHGRVTLRDPAPAAPARDPFTSEPPTEPAGLVDPRAGDEVADVDGMRLQRGGKVLIRPAPDADIQARMLDGRTATLERIFTDYDGRLHLGVTIDDDPGQELMRETGRYLYFFAQEVEVIQS